MIMDFLDPIRDFLNPSTQFHAIIAGITERGKYTCRSQQN